MTSAVYKIFSLLCKPVVAQKASACTADVQASSQKIVEELSPRFEVTIIELRSYDLKISKQVFEKCQ
jgi:hypothetical protein